MENVIEESSANKEMSPTEICCKRRSSVFQSRTLRLSGEGIEALSSSNVSSREVQTSESEKDKTFDLMGYIAALKKERETWIATLKERKSQRRLLSKKKVNLASQTRGVDLNVLSESERNFFLSCPKYEHIYYNSQKLLEPALKVALLSQLLHELNRKLTLRMEEKLHITTKKIVYLLNSNK